MCATLKNCRHRLGEDKGIPGYIMAKAESREQLECRQLLEPLLAHPQWGDEE